MIVTVQLKVPDAETVAPQLEIEAPEVTDAEIVFPGVNPVPDSVTETPLGPWEGLREIEVEVIVNVAVALSKLPSAPVAVIV